MEQEKTSTLFARYALPQMIGLVFNSVYTIVDGVFIGHRLGRQAMAAAAVSVPLIEILISLALAIGSGAAVMIASRLGRHEDSAARRIFVLAVWMTAGLGLFIVIGGNLFLQPLALLLGASADILDQSCIYLWYIVTFAPFQLFSFLLGSMARNDGCMRLAMSAMIAGALSNIFLDWFFMYPLNMGITGAALATGLGPVFSILILTGHFLFRKGRLYFEKHRGTLQEMGQILFFGFPSFIMEFTIGMVTFIYNLAISRYGFGELGLAAWLLIGYLMLIWLTVFLGMAEGLQPVFSQLMAKGCHQKSQELLRFSKAVFLGVGFVGYGLILLFCGQFYGLFSPDDLALSRFAQNQSTLFFCGFFAAGYNILMISFWQSTARTRNALIISLLRSIVWPSILMLVLPALFGREAIWICQSAAEMLTAAIAVLLQKHSSFPAGFAAGSSRLLHKRAASKKGSFPG